MTIFDILRSWLRIHKYDGFYNEDDQCACDLKSLCHCEESPVRGCEPGFKVRCTPECDHEDSENNWHIQAEEPEAKR